MKTWNVFITFESVDETLRSNCSNYWLKAFTCLLHSFSERSEIWRRKKIIITFSVPKTAMSDKYQFHPWADQHECLALYTSSLTLFFKKIWGAYQSGKFLWGHFGVERLFHQFLLSLWKAQRILIFLIYHKKKLKYSGSVLWIHDFIYELNLATTHVVDGHEIGRGLEVLPLACEQALHLRESREVTRGRHTVAALSRVLSRLASLAIQEELANRLILPHFS